MEFLGVARAPKKGNKDSAAAPAVAQRAPPTAGGRLLPGRCTLPWAGPWAVRNASGSGLGLGLAWVWLTFGLALSFILGGFGRRLGLPNIYNFI